MSTVVWLTRGVGWTVVYVGGCLLLYPLFSLWARIGVRSLDRVFADTYVATGTLLHLPLVLCFGFGVVIAGFHILGWADHREQTRHSNDDCG